MRPNVYEYHESNIALIRVCFQRNFNRTRVQRIGNAHETRFVAQLRER